MKVGLREIFPRRSNDLFWPEEDFLDNYLLWVRDVASDPQQVFPGHGQMKPEQLELARLRKELIKVKAERDILKKGAVNFAKESM